MSVPSGTSSTPTTAREAFELAMPTGYHLHDRPSMVGCCWEAADGVRRGSDKYWNAVKDAWQHYIDQHMRLTGQAVQVARDAEWRAWIRSMAAYWDRDGKHSEACAVALCASDDVGPDNPDEEDEE